MFFTLLLKRTVQKENKKMKQVLAGGLGAGGGSFMGIMEINGFFFT